MGKIVENNSYKSPKLLFSYKHSGMYKQKLFMVMLGCTPSGRNTEQHDIFFGIAEDLKALTLQMVDFWPEADGIVHIDAWRQVRQVDGYAVEVVPRTSTIVQTTGSEKKLFFVNLGGYKPGEFEEYHYKFLTVASDKGTAVQASKQTAFYKHTGFKGAPSHIDDKYGIDVDDVYEIEDVLSSHLKEKFSLVLTSNQFGAEDELHIGYVNLSGL